MHHSQWGWVKSDGTGKTCLPMDEFGGPSGDRGARTIPLSLWKLIDRWASFAGKIYLDEFIITSDYRGHAQVIIDGKGDGASAQMGDG